MTPIDHHAAIAAAVAGVAAAAGSLGLDLGLGQFAKPPQSASSVPAPAPAPYAAANEPATRPLATVGTTAPGAVAAAPATLGLSNSMGAAPFIGQTPLATQIASALATALKASEGAGRAAQHAATAPVASAAPAALATTSPAAPTASASIVKEEESPSPMRAGGAAADGAEPGAPLPAKRVDTAADGEDTTICASSADPASKAVAWRTQQHERVAAFASERARLAGDLVDAFETGVATATAATPMRPRAIGKALVLSMFSALPNEVRATQQRAPENIGSEDASFVASHLLRCFLSLSLSLSLSLVSLAGPVRVVAR